MRLVRDSHAGKWCCVVLCCVAVAVVEAMLLLSDASAGCGPRVTGAGSGLGAEQAVTLARSRPR